MKSLVISVASILIATATAFAQPASPANADQRPGGSSGPTLQGFSVVLVLGDLQAGPSSDNMPPAARKALGDMKDFLPYKSYRLLDTGWILGPIERGQYSTTRIRGPEGQDYDVLLQAAVTPPTARVVFTLREPRGSDTERREAAEEIVSLQNRRQALDNDLKQAREKYAERHPTVLKLAMELLETARRLETLNSQRKVSGGQSIINTNFTMDIGETVVVGTSRIRGDKALIALLTAVPKAP